MVINDEFLTISSGIFRSMQIVIKQLYVLLVVFSQCSHLLLVECICQIHQSFADLFIEIG